MHQSNALAKALQIALVAAWLVILFIFESGSLDAEPTGISLIDNTPTDRQSFWSEVKEVPLTALVELPEVSIAPEFMDAKALPSEIQKDKGFEELSKLLADADEKKEFDKTYIGLDKLRKKLKSGNLIEWIDILKADMLYRVQLKRDTQKLNLPLEEYSDAIRKYPLNTEKARILFQIALLQMKLELYEDVPVTITRALREHGTSEFVSGYHFLLGETAFRRKDDVTAANEYSLVIEKFPRTQAAVDSAFRKAFILFRRGDLKSALTVYDQLEQFHSNEIEVLRMKKDSQSQTKFVDRIYYAETLYQNGRFKEAADLYEDLVNLFPRHPLTPYVFVRFADTFYYRNRVRPAQELYEDVITRFKEVPAAVALAKIRLADMRFLSADGAAAESNEKGYREAFELARAAQPQNNDIASLALARLAAHYIFFKVYPRAQSTLEQYRELFKDTSNQAWVDSMYMRTVELEIFDYYKRQDYTAALSKFLVFDRAGQTKDFSNTRILISLADSAKKLQLFEKATQILNRVVYLEKTSEGRQEALLKLVDLLIVQKELRKASERLRRFNFAYPASPFAFLYEMYWGELYTQLKNPEQSISHFEKALELAQSHPASLFAIRSLYLKLADQYDGLKLPVKAIDSYERFIKLIDSYRASPITVAEVLSQDQYQVKFSKLRIADLYFNLKDYVRALEAYRLVIRDISDEPFVTHARFRLGECFLNLNDRPSALKAFQSIQVKDPQNLWARAARSYIQTVEMEDKYGIRILN